MRRILLLALIAVGLVQAGTAQAKPAGKSRAQPKQVADTVEVERAFEAFCSEWMRKLAAREHDNIALISWNTGPDGVQGEYVGYTTEHTCVVKNGGSIPVGKITYLEVRYAKQGRTIEEARQSQALALETTGVTEIFRYDKNKWVY